MRTVVAGVPPAHNWFAADTARLYSLNEIIVQTDFRGIVSAPCTPEL
jgi:hypothetical protein